MDVGCVMKLYISEDRERERKRGKWGVVVDIFTIRVFITRALVKLSRLLCVHVTLQGLIIIYFFRSFIEKENYIFTFILG